VPAGKALIIQSMTALLFNTGSEAQVLLYAKANCAGEVIAAASTDRATETVAQTFGSGIAVPAGRTISATGLSNIGSAEIYGYLVPASYVPVNANSTVASPATTAGANSLKASH
jgi:hypothetical protein